MSRKWLFLVLLIPMTALFVWAACKGEVGDEYGEPTTREDSPVLYYFLMGIQLFALLAGWGLVFLGSW